MDLIKKVRMAAMPNSSILTTRLSDGLLIQGENRSGFGGRGIYLYGDNIEPEYGQFTKLLPDNHGVMIDIGASTGIYGLRAARHFRGTGTVIAVEPVAAVYASLTRNAELNGLENMRCRSFCIGEKTGTSLLWMNQNKPQSYSLTHRQGEAGGMSVLVVSLDDLVAWEGIERLDYLKIDAEGAEESILRGGAKTIQRFRPIVQAETIIGHALPELPDYAVYRAPGSPNVVAIPVEHEKHVIAESLGWNLVTGVPAGIPSPVEARKPVAVIS